jgi:hypothetical protein
MIYPLPWGSHQDTLKTEGEIRVFTMSCNVKFNFFQNLNSFQLVTLPSLDGRGFRGG